MSAYAIGDEITTTVHMRSSRSAEVTGTITAVTMSRKTPGKVITYTVDASAAGYGSLCVPVADARGRDQR